MPSKQLNSSTELYPQHSTYGFDHSLQTQETWNAKGISHKAYSENHCVHPPLCAELSQTEMYQQQL